MAPKKATTAFLISLMIAGLALSSLYYVNAESSIPKPSVPQFTVHFEGPSFLRNTTYELDRNTGEVAADLGYTNQYSTIVLTIQNQPFDSSKGNLYYGIHLRTRPGGEWMNVTYDGPYPEQSTDSKVTALKLNIQGQWSVPNLAGTHLEIQVQAMLGNFYYGHVYTFGGWMFSGEVSDWSSAQIVDVPANVQLTPTPPPHSSSVPSNAPASPTTATSNQTDTVSDSQSPWIIANTLAVGFGIIIALLIVVIILMHKKIRFLEVKQNGP
ncbi:MAG: hypothetical protein ACQCN6_05060 [Candidatus Bathyarchaeia archaeon]|jgi:hypothetical protein